MKFDLNNSFDDNIALFKMEAEKIDPECAKILFDNLDLLDVDDGATSNRAAIGEFHRAVAAALDAMPKPTEDAKS